MENQKIKKLNGIGIKLLFIVLVILGLLIGLARINGLLNDREDSYLNAKFQISESAGSNLRLQGPFIAIPYVTKWNEFVYRDGHQFSEEKSQEGWKIINADYVNIESEVNSETRRVGIYSNPIFTSSNNVYATIQQQLPSSTEDTSYDLEKSIVYFAIKNSSLTCSPVFNMNDKNYDTDPITFDGKTVVGAYIPLSTEKNIFKTKLGLRGAEDFSYTISAKDTRLTMKSDWTSPGFTGYSYLPDKHTIFDNGFSAEWNVHFGSSDAKEVIGFSFIEPVNLYQKLHRATKYGFLFILVPFLVLFLFETFAKIILHPVHYLLSGAACILFFLLLLALSEHIPFDLSYIFAALTASITVALYISSVTKKFVLGILMEGIFAILYGYLFVSLRSEDYALLFGAFFAFAILVMIMFITRKIDWYNLKGKKNSDTRLLQVSELKQ